MKIKILQRLKVLIDYIFDNKTNDKYLKIIIFKDNQREYKEILQIHYKKEEIYKMMKALNNNISYVIEFTGTPRTGKNKFMG